MMVLGFGFLIFVHELGHFIAAKWAGIRTEGFAIGMGPVLAAFRRGVGATVGSTDRKVVALAGKSASELSDAELARHGLGETEYSLRVLPFGGFVKMLGQDDARPGAMSDDPRSYNRCPVGKRMIVVSAGVVMNLLTAAAFFVIAFSVGVRFEAPIIGQVAPGMPAAAAPALNAQSSGVTGRGLRAGDRVVSIDGDRADTFSNIVIASAMAKPDQSIRFVVERPGVETPLEFDLLPAKGPDGLLSIGVAPAASTTLFRAEESRAIEVELESAGLAAQGVEPGMTLIRANGVAVRTYEQFADVVRASSGGPIETEWSRQEGETPGDGSVVRARLETRPELVDYRYRDRTPDAALVGLSPLVVVTGHTDETNSETLLPGDLIARAGGVDFPRRSQLLAEVAAVDGRSELAMVVLRDGRRVETIARANGDGALGIRISLALETPLIAQPILERPVFDESDATRLVDKATPLADDPPLPGSRLVAVNGTPIESWEQIWRQLREAVGDGDGAATLEMRLAAPTAESEQEVLAVDLTSAQADELRDLGWMADLSPFAFESLYVNRSADGNPLRAVRMGLEETHKGVMLTYLTIDRLFRGSVSVEQLRGPVGIVDLGVKILPRGFMYFLFFLGLISVNLAVLNFLPLPIVDGGLFLFLIYEKLKGRPPAVAFQNGACLAGIVLLGALFLYITFNDVQRLF
jgi:regulator of sigma E protease